MLLQPEEKALSHIEEGFVYYLTIIKREVNAVNSSKV